MSDEKKNADQPQKQEPQRRNPREDFKEQLKRIRDEAVGDLTKSLGMPKEDAAASRRDETPFSRGRPPTRSPDLWGNKAEAMPAKASGTDAPSAPGKSRITVSGQILVQHRARRDVPGYEPNGEIEQLMDAKDAGQYHVAATAGGMSESVNGVAGLQRIREIYHKLGKDAAGAEDPKGKVGTLYPHADPSQVEKGMVDQTTTGMRLIKEAFKDGYAGKELKPTSEMLQEQQGRRKGATTRSSGVVGSLWNKLRGSSEFGVTSNAVAGVRGSQTEAPEAAYARKLLQDGHLRDGDIDAVLALLDSTDQGAGEQLKTLLAKYRAGGIGTG